MKLTIILLAACGASHSPATNAPTFELGELAVLDGSDVMVRVHADGTTEVGYHHGMLALVPGTAATTDSLPVSFSPGPTVKPDGTLERAGKPVARLDANGTMIDLTTHQPFAIQVTADQLTLPVRGEPEAITLAADGTFTVPPGATMKGLHATGADTPGKRRLVLAMLGVLLGEGEAPTTETSAASVPAP